MSKIEFNITCLPAKEIIVVCGQCHGEILRLKYDDYADQNSKLEQLKAAELYCQKCGVKSKQEE